MGTPQQLIRPVVLVGMMGSGKTAVGTALAARLKVPFIDQDHEIEAAANRSVAEIFEQHGEAFFRSKETQVLERLLAGPPGVLSTGGGAFLSQCNRELIAAHGVAVWLKVAVELLWARVKGRTHRPLLRTENPRERLRELAETRAPIYALAPIHVEAQPGFSVEDMAAAVHAALATRPDILRSRQNARR